MRKIFTLSVLVLFAISVFLSSYSDKPIFASRQDGNVLSASAQLQEVAASDVHAASETAGFPKSEDKPRPPKKTGGIISFPGLSAAAIDAASGEILYNGSGDEPVQIASITKLATALVFLKHNPGWDMVYEVRESDMVPGGKDYIRPGDRLSGRELFALALVASENNAARALASLSGLEEADFVAEMNALSGELGLGKTSFKDPVGLSRSNVSTPKEVASLARFAFSDPDIAGIIKKDAAEFRPVGKQSRKAVATNELIGKDGGGISMVGGKTGFTALAGYCFVGKFRDKAGHEIITAILGDSSKSGRFSDSRELAEAVFGNYSWD